MLGQKKIELAVLHKLYEYAQANLASPTPVMIAVSLQVPEISFRRVEVALEELEAVGQAQAVPDPSAGVYRWIITRDGFGVVDRALRIPTTFISRLSVNGDGWLLTEEAEKAVLQKLAKRPEPAEPEEPTPQTVPIPPITITNTFAPTNSNQFRAPQGGHGIQWASWTNAGIALLVGVGVIIATLWVAGKI